MTKIGELAETAQERQRRETNEKICKDFQQLNPKMMEEGYKPYRTFAVLAQKYGKTTAGIRHILVNAGIYTSAEELAEESN